MKILFFILALAATGAAGFFAYQTDQLVEQELAALADAEKTKGTRITQRKDQRDVTGKEEVAREDARDGLATTRAEIQSIISKSTKASKSVTDLEGSLEGVESQIAAKKDNLNEAKAILEGLFPGEEIDFNNFEEKFNKLEETAKELTEKRDELDLLAEQSAKALATAQADVERRVEKQTKYQSNLNQNSLSGLVTAVNSDWGFAVVNLGLSDGIDPDNELLVVRGGQRVGRLALTSIENGQSVANILYDSLTPGSMIRPGDKVMLAKPNRGN